MINGPAQATSECLKLAQDPSFRPISLNIQPIDTIIFYILIRKIVVKSASGWLQDTHLYIYLLYRQARIQGGGLPPQSAADEDGRLCFKASRRLAFTLTWFAFSLQPIRYWVASRLNEIKHKPEDELVYFFCQYKKILTCWRWYKTSRWITYR